MKRPTSFILLTCVLVIGLGGSAFLIRHHQAAGVAPNSKREPDSQETQAINDWQRGIKIDRRSSYTPIQSTDHKQRRAPQTEQPWPNPEEERD